MASTKVLAVERVGGIFGQRGGLSLARRRERNKRARACKMSHCKVFRRPERCRENRISARADAPFHRRAGCDLTWRRADSARTRAGSASLSIVSRGARGPRCENRAREERASPLRSLSPCASVAGIGAGNGTLDTTDLDTGRIEAYI